MADEPDENKTHPDHDEDTDKITAEHDGHDVDEDSDGEADDGNGTDTDTDTDTDTETENGDDDDGPARLSWGRVTAKHRNMGALGVLTIHYPAREVNLVMDGDAALRLMQIVKSGVTRGLSDVLDARVSDAHNGWVVARIDEPLALSWSPNIDAWIGRPRMAAIDPL